MSVCELCLDQEQYAALVEKNTLAKLIAASEINGVELDTLAASILEKGISMRVPAPRWKQLIMSSKMIIINVAI